MFPVANEVIQFRLVQFTTLHFHPSRFSALLVTYNMRYNLTSKQKRYFDSESEKLISRHLIVLYIISNIFFLLYKIENQTMKTFKAS